MKALFIDKDGTLIEDVPYNRDIGQIRLAYGAEDALRRVRDAGYAVFLVTNQDGIGRGLLSHGDVVRAYERINELLGHGSLDGIFYCSHEAGANCSCRKPASGLLLEAAKAHGIALRDSWMVGDILNDVEAGKNSGCRTVLLNNGNETEWDLGRPARVPDFVAADLAQAADLICADAAAAPVANTKHFADWQRAKKLLCIRLDSLGDVLMTSAAIKALKASCAGRSITLLTSRAGAAAAELIPSIDDTIVYEAPWMKATSASRAPEADKMMIELLQRQHFDAAVIFTVYSQNPLPAAFLCCLAGIPLRLAHCRENPYHLLSDWIHEREPEKEIRHEAARQLALAAAVGAQCADRRLDVSVDDEARQCIEQKLAAYRVRPPLIIIHPGASAPSRRYRPEGFARAAALIYLRLGATLIFTGTREERDLVDSIREQAGVPTYSFAGELPVRHLAALLETADLLISNNTGPVHIAAGLGIPVVDLYALTNPQHAPWLTEHRMLNKDVPCKYCYKSLCPLGHHECLAAVTPESILAAVEQLLPAAGPSYSHSDARGSVCTL